MSQTIRAIYRSGQLYPLEPLQFAEGQEIQVIIPSLDEAIASALGDLLVAPSLSKARATPFMPIQLANGVTLSDAIIAERQEAP